MPEKIWIFDNTTDDIDPNGEFLTTRVSVLEKLGKKYFRDKHAFFKCL